MVVVEWCVGDIDPPVIECANGCVAHPPPNTLILQAYKWTHHVFFWFLDTAIVNAYELYIAYGNHNRKKHSLLRFKKRLLFQLLARVVMEKQSGSKRRCLSPMMVPTAEQLEALKRRRDGEVTEVQGAHQWKDEATGLVHWQVRKKTRAPCKMCQAEASAAAGVRGSRNAFGVSAKKVNLMCSVSGAAICKDHWERFHTTCTSVCCNNYVNGKKQKRAKTGENAVFASPPSTVSQRSVAHRIADQQRRQQQSRRGLPFRPHP